MGPGVEITAVVWGERISCERRGERGERRDTNHSMPKPKRTCVAANTTWVKRKTAARRYGAWVGPSRTSRMRERWEMMGKRWRREAAHGLCEARRRRLEARCCELGESFERRTPGRLRIRGTDGIVRFVSSSSSSSSSLLLRSRSVGLPANEGDQGRRTGGRGNVRCCCRCCRCCYCSSGTRTETTGTGRRPKEGNFCGAKQAIKS